MSNSVPLEAEEQSRARLPSFEARLTAATRELQRDARLLEQSCQRELAEVHAEHRDGARNLLHYLAVRQRDIRELQRELASLGLSSLGRMEKSVLSTLKKVEHALCLLDGKKPAPVEASDLDPGRGEALLERHATTLLGPTPEGRKSRIMVTLASDTDATQIKDLLAAGMNVARINCSKGDRDAWLRLVNDVRVISNEASLRCPVLFDLAGPNPRTRWLHKNDKTVKLQVGDNILLCASGKDAKKHRHAWPEAFALGCTLPEILPRLRPGETVSYDDGRWVGMVREADGEVALVELTHTAKPSIKLRESKGLNFPNSELPFPSMTEKDLRDLDFIAEHGDLVGLSFVRSCSDVERVQEELRARQASHVGLMLKIETTRAFNDLGRLLLTAMRNERVGVMVARGDMAVELGFMRLAEAQEEVLWLSEAALVPVIWATQVLENLSKTGVPSRAEVTDAAMSGRAECVMLNRGKYTEQAVRFLDDVLQRMQAHQEKKSSMLRRLHISEFPQEARG